MKKEVRLRDLVEPLIILPYGFWAMYWFENGFNWIVAVVGAILFFIIFPIIVFTWDNI